MRLPADPLAPVRLLTSTQSHEDAAVVRLPESMGSAGGKVLVQTLDFFTPVVNNPYAFGQISAANALSDVYAMGGEPWCAMNIVCFPAKDMPEEILTAVLQGGSDKLAEAGVVLAGGHSVDDPEIKYGLSVTGFVDAAHFASNTGLKAGHQLVLTKALGTGILATALKAQWEGEEEFERLLIATASRLNSGAGRVIRELGLTAATDITGFGLGGHLLEMAEASQVGVQLQASAIPVLPHVLELASVGLVPSGTHMNRRHRVAETLVAEGVDPLIVDVIFDAQTSGGMVLAVPDSKLDKAIALLQEYGDEAHHVGSVFPFAGGQRLKITV